MKTLLLFALVAGAAAQSAPKNYAQKLVDEAMVSHPDVLILALHAKSPDNPNYPIIAWGGPTGNKVRIGKKADEDDLRVIKTGKENLEVAPSGDRYEVELPLLDRAGSTLGAVGIVYRYKTSDDKAEFKRKAEQLRDEMRREIPSAAKLFEPAQ